MDKFNFVAIVFLFLPGFVADGVYRLLHGSTELTSEVQRLLRALMWSFLGVGIMVAFQGTVPPYMQRIDSTHATLLAQFDWAAVVSLATQTGAASLLAFLTALMMRAVEANVARRGLGTPSAWNRLRQDAGRNTSVVIKLRDGSHARGILRAIGAGSKADLLIEHEQMRESERNADAVPASQSSLPAEQVEYTWIPRSQISAVQLIRGGEPERSWWRTLWAPRSPNSLTLPQLTSNADEAAVFTPNDTTGPDDSTPHLGLGKRGVQPTAGTLSASVEPPQSNGER